MTYEVGKYYEVPHVRTKWPGTGGRVIWVPVLGPSHDDVEIIKFEHEHWHVDYRFLTARLKRLSVRWTVPGAEVYVLPVSRVFPVGYKAKGSQFGTEYDNSLWVSELPQMDIDQETYIKPKRSLCKAEQLKLPKLDALPWQRPTRTSA